MMARVLVVGGLWLNRLPADRQVDGGGFVNPEPRPL
jgi:hypothetical protein